MKVIYFLALATSKVEANWSLGACPTSFPDIGIADSIMDLNTYVGGATKDIYGVGYPAADVAQQTWIELWRTKTSAWELGADCTSSKYSMVSGTTNKVTEKRKAYFWYAFLTYWNSDSITKWDTTKSTGYTTQEYYINLT